MDCSCISFMWNTELSDIKRFNTSCSVEDGKLNTQREREKKKSASCCPVLECRIGESSVYWQFMTKTALVFHLKWIMLSPSLHKSFESYAVLFKRHEDTSAGVVEGEERLYESCSISRPINWSSIEETCEEPPTHKTYIPGINWRSQEALIYSTIDNIRTG